MDKEHVRKVAEETFNQLFGLTAGNILGSWGIFNVKPCIFKDKPALALSVSARLFQGDVVIALNEGKDYYEIWLCNEKEYKMIAEDVDFTQLGEIIDVEIERGPDPEEYQEYIKSISLDL